MLSPCSGTDRQPVLEVKRLGIAYGSVQVVHDISLTVAPGEALGIVGESGCGKSQSMLATLRLLPRGGRVTSGTIHFEGRNILDLSARKMRALRGSGLALISQDALSALNPAMTIGAQMAEPLVHCAGMSRDAARKRCVELLDLVAIPGATQRLSVYPHELSGGMRQRVLIAMAVSDNPKVLIADEPTTALDVTTQAQILRLIDRLRADLGMALVLITHDLGVVAGVTDRVAVMYAGRIVEEATTEELFALPRHPYTRALLEATSGLEAQGSTRMSPIPGLPPDPRHPVTGCAFHPRCAFAQAVCLSALPKFDGDMHRFRCHVDPFAPAIKSIALGGAA